MRTMLFASCLLGALVQVTHAGVFVVDDSGGLGVTHLDIGAAVAAAADGDLILVRSGNYPAFVVDGIAVDVVADSNAVVVVQNSVTIRNLASSQHVLVRGIAVVAPASNQYTVSDLANAEGCLRVSDVDGLVVVEDCVLSGSRACVRVSAARLNLERVQAKAGPAFVFAFTGMPAGLGLDALDSAISIDRCLLVGGDGYNDNIGNGGGGAGARFDASTAYAVGSTLKGGTGNAAAYMGLGLCLHGGNGGPGLVAVGAQAVVRIAASSILGGPGGAPSLPAPIACPGGTAGVPIVASGGAQVTDTVLATARGVTVDAPTRVGQATTLTFEGVTGDAVFLFWGATPEQTTYAIYDHSLLATPAVLVMLGTMPAATWPVPATMQPIVGGGLSHVVYAQAAMIDANGDVVLGGASTIVALDASL